MRSSSKIIKNKYQALGEPIVREKEKEIVAEELAATYDYWPKDIPEEEPQPVDLEAQGEELYREAQLKSAQLLKAAEQDAKKIKEEAHNEGYNQGLEKAKNECELRLQSELQLLGQTLSQVPDLKIRTVKEAESTLTKILALAIEKIVRIKTAKDNEVIVRLLDELLPQVAETEELVIQVSKDDLERVTGYKDTISALCPKVSEIKIIASDEIDKGGCILNTSIGNIDAKLDVQIQRILEKIYAVGTGDSHE